MPVSSSRMAARTQLGRSHKAVCKPRGSGQSGQVQIESESEEREGMIGVVRRLGEEMKRQPTQRELRAAIREEDCRRVFGDYCALLRAAGYRGQLRSKRVNADRRKEMLIDFGRVSGELGRFPSTGEYQRRGLFTYRMIKKVFSSWEQVRSESVALAGGPEKWKATLRTLALEKGLVTYAPRVDRPVCGTPLNYRAMLHEPTNEQGVVLLFGMMAEELGFIIENVRTSYPDCEGKRRVGVNSWQRVRIEFEFLSSRFKHPEEGCDLIVCWRDDEPARKGLEVIALEKVLKERKEGSPEMTKSLPWGRHTGRKAGKGASGKLKAVPRDD